MSPLELLLVLGEFTKTQSYRVARNVPEPVRGPPQRLIEPVATALYRAIAGAVVPDTWAITTHGYTILFKISNFDEYVQFRRFPEKDSSFPLPGDILRRLGWDDVFWDIGANIGIYSCFAAAKLSSGRVVSIEPNPSNAARIEENLRLNGLSATVMQRALMANSGQETLDVTDDVGAGAHGRINKGKTDGITVETATGDGLVEDGVPAPSVVKVDVQGAERIVLQGMESVLSNPECRAVYVNAYTSDSQGYYGCGGPKNEEERLLRAHGFMVERIHEWEDGYFVRALREGPATV